MQSNIQRAGKRSEARLTRSKIPGEGWSLDKFGPLRTAGLDKTRYWLLAVDDASLLVKVWFLKDAKAEHQLACVKTLFAWVLTQTGRRVKRLRTDGEWCSIAFKQYQAEWGFEHFRTNRDTPSSNGIAERLGGIIMAKARAMLVAASAPAFLFPEALSYAVYVYNRTCKASGYVHAPLDKFNCVEPTNSCKPEPTSRNFTVHQLRVFGTLCVFRDDSRKTGKNEARGVRGVFVGCDPTTRSWRIYVPSTRALRISRDVFFDESTFWYKVGGSEKPLPSPLLEQDDDFSRLSQSEMMYQDFLLPASPAAERESSDIHHLLPSVPDNAQEAQAIPMDVPDDGFVPMDVKGSLDDKSQGRSSVGGTPPMEEPLEFIATLAHCFATSGGPTEDEAYSNPKWVDAMKRELQSL